MQGYRVLVFQADKWEECVMGKHLDYCFDGTGMGEGPIVRIGPEFEQNTDTNVTFTFTPEVGLNAMSISIRNREEDEYTGDVILHKETVEVED